MIIEAGGRAFAGDAAAVAVMLGERGLGGNDPDLELRYRRWRSARGPRAEGARRLADRWARGFTAGEAGANIGRSLGLAFPDRVARRRDPSGEHWQSVGGRGFRLDPTSPLARSEWLAVGEVAGAAAGARILSAASLDLADVEALFADRIESWSEVRFDPAGGSITARHGRRLGSVRLSSGPDPSPDPAAIEAALLDAVRRHGLDLLPWPQDAAALRHRAAFAALHDPDIAPLDDEALLATLDDWLAPLLHGRRRLDVERELLAALQGMLGYAGVRRVDQLAPASFASPAGSTHPIDYGAPGGPAVEVRAQALYGLGSHPTVAGGRVPLTLAITSPAHRPIQTTKDLPAFWAGSWREVAREMRGRYPRHPWPDDPANAQPTLRTKRAGERSSS
jgi:ATP-dependent helicase HrpB